MEVFSSILLLISFMWYLFWKTSRSKQLPPGPRPVPLIGNLLQLDMRNPLKDFDKFAQKYGPVFSLQMGGNLYVLVHGFPLVKEVLVTKGTEFAGRPQDPVLEVITKGKGIISVSYGQAWKEQRRFSLMVLRNFGLGKKAVEERIQDEVAYLMQSVREKKGPRGCLGVSLARMELFLFFTSLLRKFQVVWSDKSKVPDVTPCYGVTLSPAPFKVALKCHWQT